MKLIKKIGDVCLFTGMTMIGVFAALEFFGKKQEILLYGGLGLMCITLVLILYTNIKTTGCLWRS